MELNQMEEKNEEVKKQDKKDDDDIKLSDITDFVSFKKKMKEILKDIPPEDLAAAGIV